MQASAAERLVDPDPEAAKEMMRSVRAQGRRTLDNLRTAVGVLRDSGAIAESGGDDAGAPVPGLAVLDGLLEDARSAGAAPAAPAAASTRGFGLIGMRERVALLGGSLEAGPGPDDGWQVRAHLPDARTPVEQR